MPIKIRVRKFQSIEDTTVVLDGFTVITGPNNSGKTALVRAIRGVFLNSPAGPLVRRGAAHLSVDIDFGDGNTVTWEKGWEKPEQKGKTVNRYVVNGVEVSDVGRGCPPEVLAIGLNPIKAGTDTVWPQIADQFKGVLFLVGAPGSSMAEAIANVDRVGKLSAALKLSESARRKVTSKLNVRREDEKALEKEVEAYDGLDAVGDLVTTVEAAATKAGTLFTEMAVAMSLRKRWDLANGEVTALVGIEDVEIPRDPSDIELLRDKLADLTRIRDTLARRCAEVEVLGGIDFVDVPDSAAVVASQTLRDDLAALRHLSTRHKAAKGTLDALAGYADVKLPEDSKATKIKRTLGYLQGLAGRRDAALVSIEQLEEGGRLADVEATTAEATVTTLLAELGQCPTCGVATGGDAHVHKESA